MHRRRNKRASCEIDSISRPTSWRDLRDNERGSAADEDAILISILLPRRKGRKKFSDEEGRQRNDAPTFLLFSCADYASFISRRRLVETRRSFMRRRSSINRLTGFPDGHTRVT